MTLNEVISIPSTTRPIAGKYLTFALGREAYGIGALKVREIIRLSDVTAAPSMPGCAKDVINVRGTFVPLVDLRVKFCASEAETTERTSIVIAQATIATGARAMIGLIVDAIEEVIHLGPGDLEETPGFDAGLATDCVLGVAHVRGIVKTLLDIDRLVPVEIAAA